MLGNGFGCFWLFELFEYIIYVYNVFVGENLIFSCLGVIQFHFLARNARLPGNCFGIAIVEFLVFRVRGHDDWLHHTRKTRAKDQAQAHTQWPPQEEQRRAKKNKEGQKKTKNKMETQRRTEQNKEEQGHEQEHKHPAGVIAAQAVVYTFLKIKTLAPLQRLSHFCRRLGVTSRSGFVKMKNDITQMICEDIERMVCVSQEEMSLTS